MSARTHRLLATFTISVMLGSVAACGAKVDDESVSATSCVDTTGDSVKIGLLNSLSGSMAISETTVNRALLLATEEINASGGVLGRQLVPVTEDGQSEPTVFAEKAEGLIQSDCVAAIFGGWTSPARKAMLPVVEANNSLLFYPVQYEGLEASPNIYYTGATANQQILPALEWLQSEQDVKTLFLVGVDNVFARTANDIITKYAAANDIVIVEEQYQPMGGTSFGSVVDQIKAADADAVFSTLNGDSNVAFYKEFAGKGLTAQDTPVISVSIAEEEIPGIGIDNLVGQYTAWNYYQSVDSDQNAAFVTAYRAMYGESAVTSDPMESAYTSLYLWKALVEKAGSFDVDAINAAADGVSVAAPEGTVTVDGETHHVTKTARIGQIMADGQIETIWSSPEPIEPDPFLTGFDWYSAP